MTLWYSCDLHTYYKSYRKKFKDFPTFFVFFHRNCKQIWFNGPQSKGELQLNLVMYTVFTLGTVDCRMNDFINQNITFILFIQVFKTRVSSHLQKPMFRKRITRALLFAFLN